MPVSSQSGFTFPMIQKGPQGRVNYVHNDSQGLISDSVLQILLTTPGERMWNPSFGCRIQLLQFESYSTDIAILIVNLILEALHKWEPRILITAKDIVVSASLEVETKLDIQVNFKIISPDFTSNQTSSVVISL